MKKFTEFIKLFTNYLRCIFGESVKQVEFIEETPETVEEIPETVKETPEVEEILKKVKSKSKKTRK